jgi:hypothetical protein
MIAYRLAGLEQSEGGLSGEVGGADDIGLTASGGLVLVGRAHKAVSALCNEAVDVGSEVTVNHIGKKISLHKQSMQAQALRQWIKGFPAQSGIRI